MTTTEERPLLDVASSPEGLMELAELEGWGDGLPLVPPTADRVDDMLGPWQAVRHASFGTVYPYRGEATYEAVAVNAVMSGCRPEYFPVVCAAVSCVVDPEYNLYALQATTSPATPMVVVNGPLARTLNFNSRGNAFGPGWRANATVGRALRLILLNIGGGRPRALAGVGTSQLPAFDYATQGSPSKYGFCAAENEEDSPWEPLHVERGLAAEDSAVTVIGADSIHGFRDVTSQTSDEVLACLAAGVSIWGTANVLYGAEPVLVIGPERAGELARAGWAKNDVKKYVFERGRIDISRLPANSQAVHKQRRPKWTDVHNFPVFDSPEDLVILVVGGPGIQSAYISTFSGTRSVTRKIQTDVAAR